MRGVTGLVAVWLIVLPPFVGTRLPVWTGGLTYFVIFGSLSLLLWTSGQISLCHLAFVAVGATTMGHVQSAGLPWLPALLVAGLTVVPVGALVAVPAIRTSGIYLALVTLGFGVLMQSVVFQSGLMFGPTLTISARRPDLGPIDATSDTALYYTFLVIAGLVAIALLLIQRGRLGRLLRAMATSPAMLSTQGLSVNLTRLTVFCLSALFAGIGGAMLVTQSGEVSGVGFGPVQSLLLLAVLPMCGTRLLRSAMIATVLFAVLPGYVREIDVDKQTLMFGVGAVASGLVLASRVQVVQWFRRVAAEGDERRTHGPVASRMRSANDVRSLSRSMPAASRPT
jgi:ABC-type branched-subunit amino acid transport system permease subunit